MKKIGIDIRCLTEGRNTGVEEYTLNFLKHLFEMDKKNKYVLFLNSYRNPKTDLSWIKKFSNVSLKRFNYPNKLLNFLFWYFNWPKLDKLIGGADYFFLPNIIFGRASANTKMIATIHDLSFRRYPETYSWKKRLWHVFVNPKKICEEAHKIIAVSNSTKNDLLSLFKIKNPEKICVIRSGISEKFQVIGRNDGRLLEIKEKYNLPYKFILYLGTIEPRKNILGIVRAFNQLQKIAKHKKNEELGKYKLVIAGSPGWLNGPIFAEIEKSNSRKNIQIVNSVDDEDRPYIFNLASLFVYPSFFEGFGFPPLEAMKCGVPAIISNCSSLPEVAGDGAVMIDPDKPDEMARAMEEILTDKNLRAMLIAKGLKHAQNFNWNKTVEEFLKLLA
jgi:glycosyltransferase involved in cell wall biosynthesis